MSTVQDLKKQIEQQEKPQAPEKPDHGYRAYGKAPHKGVQFLKLLFKNGDVDLVPYSLMGLIRYIPEKNLLLVAASGQQLEVTGVNLGKAVDLLQYRECGFFCELPDALESKQFSDDTPAITDIRWVKPKQPPSRV